jgi:hypothetical protein
MGKELDEPSVRGGNWAMALLYVIQLKLAAFPPKEKQSCCPFGVTAKPVR